MTAENLTGLNWRKSSYSSSNAQCVEVATVGADRASRPHGMAGTAGRADHALGAATRDSLPGPARNVAWSW